MNATVVDREGTLQGGVVVHSGTARGRVPRGEEDGDSSGRTMHEG